MLSHPNETRAAKAPFLLKLFPKSKSIVIAYELENNLVMLKVDLYYPMHEIIIMITLRCN